jgi:hypothetical protein
MIGSRCVGQQSTRPRPEGRVEQNCVECKHNALPAGRYGDSFILMAGREGAMKCEPVAPE